ncbi:MAG: nascent polypeptide-associated complex protein [Candidatus Aenigmarchaeota archaeon]|nr:nascent polypeptide-associated complex protein [Candidatus Aenigmarchaeota archaeon]
MKINPKQLERAMKQMGMHMTHIDAEEVIIKTSDKEIVITEPEVSMVNMMGQETFQITGNITEREREEFSDDDVEMIMDETGASEEDVRKMLKETNDLAETIMKLKKE